MTAAGGIKKGTEILMPYGSVYWKQRETDARHDARYGRRDARRGGMIAYTIHTGRRVVYVEELVRSWESTGHKLQTGHALLSRMLDEVRGDVDAVHLIVRRDNVHARALYNRVGFSEVPWELYEPMENEVYMVAQVSNMHRMLVRAWTAPTQWEVETGACTKRLREEDRVWARQMYEEEHGSTRRWTQHHAHQAAHILMWDGTGVGVAVEVARRGRACEHGTGTTVVRRGRQQDAGEAYIHGGAMGAGQQHSSIQQGAAPGGTALAGDDGARVEDGGVGGPGSGSAHVRSSGKRAQREEAVGDEASGGATGARRAPGREIGRVRSEVVRSRSAAPAASGEGQPAGGCGGGRRDHVRRRHATAGRGSSGGTSARGGTRGSGGGRSGGGGAHGEDAIRWGVDTTRHNLVHEAETAGVIHLDDGFTNGKRSAGNAEVEGITEAEYMRGVKRKREKKDDTPPSPPSPSPLPPSP